VGGKQVIMQPNEKYGEPYSPGVFGINNALRGPWAGCMLASFALFASGLLWQLAIGFPSFGSDEWTLRHGSRQTAVEPVLWGISFAAMVVCITSCLVGNVLYFTSADKVPANPRSRAFVMAHYLFAAACVLFSLLIAIIGI
jgi:hypothetical protein